MVDSLKRRQLSQHLRQLVTGRATNDEFDEWYYNDYETSEDRATQAISAFGYSLYSDLWPYRLRGVHAVDKETRRTAARCVLFLRSKLEYGDCKDFCVSLTWHGHLGHAASSAGSRCHKILYSPEYEWPEPPDSLAGRFLKGNALFLGLPLGVAAPICSLPLICVKEYAMAITLGSVGVALVFLAVWTTWFWSPCARAYRKWRELGDYDAWPFLRASDLDRARFKAHSKADGMK